MPVCAVDFSGCLEKADLVSKCREVTPDSLAEAAYPEPPLVPPPAATSASAAPPPAGTPTAYRHPTMMHAWRVWFWKVVLIFRVVSLPS